MSDIYDVEPFGDELPEECPISAYHALEHLFNAHRELLKISDLVETLHECDIPQVFHEVDIAARIVSRLTRPETPLPCPFCGEIPAVQPEDPKTQGNAFGQVECVNKHCPVQPICGDGEDCADDRGSEAYKQAAVRRWNRRIENERE